MARAHTGHRGASKLRKTLHTHQAGTKLTKSDLEVLLRQLFAEQRLIVEADGWAYHKTRRAFESDRARDVLLATAGYRTLRFTDRQLATKPREVGAAIATVLADRPAA